MKNICIALLLCVPFWVNAQVNFQNGANNAALAGASVADDQTGTLILNPASGLLKSKQFFIATNLANRYGLAGLTHRNLLGAYGVKNVNLYVYLEQFGNSYYRQTLYATGVSFSLSPTVRMGARLYSVQTTQIEFGSRYELGGALGLVYSLNTHFKMGFRIEPLGLMRNSANSRNMIGCSWFPNALLRFHLMFSQPGYGQGDVHAGLSYRLSKLILLKGGLQLNQQAYFMGFSIALHSVMIHTSFSIYSALGNAGEVGLQYSSSLDN